MTEPRRLSLEHIERAAEIIDPVFLNSPQFRAESLERQLDCRIVVKVEILNPIRSFKGRGAEYLAASLDGRPHLVCATAGNFGQGMAYARLGDKDKAFEWLEKAYRERDGVRLGFINSNSGFNNLHGDRRFSDLLRRLGLPE